MNQADLRLLAQERIQDAAALLQGGRWAFAYYVAGYAVECALKSCVLARMVETGWIFEERSTSKAKFDDCLTHDLLKLVRLAGLENELNHLLQTNPAFLTNWTSVKKWDVVVRYQAKTEAEARSIFSAITDDPDGVMKWLQKYW